MTFPMNFNINFQYSEDDLLRSGVSVQDECKDLKLYCYDYDSCKDDSPDIVKSSRGVIFKNDNLIACGFPYTNEYVVRTQDDIKDIDLTKTRFFSAYEGCIIRVYNYEDEWFISTNRCFDASSSKWGSHISFGQYFMQALGFSKDQFNEKFDKNHVHVFLLCNTEVNRIVCDGQVKTYYIGWFEVGKTTFYFSNDNEYHSFSVPTEYKFSSLDILYNAIQETDVRRSSGFVCFTEDRIFKLTSPRYHYLYSIRGNQPSVMFQYLKIRQSEGKVIDVDDEKVMTDFKELYPNFAERMENYEKLVTRACDYLLEKYQERYRLHKQNTVSRAENDTIKKCHGIFTSGGRVNPVTRETILKVVNGQSPVFLNEIIKNQYKRENPSKVVVEE